MSGGRPPNQMQRVTAVMPRPGLGSGASDQSAAKEIFRYYCFSRKAVTFIKEIVYNGKKAIAEMMLCCERARQR